MKWRGDAGKEGSLHKMCYDGSIPPRATGMWPLREPSKRIQQNGLSKDKFIHELSPLLIEACSWGRGLPCAQARHAHWPQKAPGRDMCGGQGLSTKVSGNIQPRQGRAGPHLPRDVGIHIFLSLEATAPMGLASSHKLVSSNTGAVPCTHAKSLQLCPILGKPMDYSSPGSSVHGDFSREKYWSGLPRPPPGNLSNPGIEPMSPALAGRFFTTSATWEALGLAQAHSKTGSYPRWSCYERSEETLNLLKRKNKRQRQGWGSRMTLHRTNLTYKKFSYSLYKAPETKYLLPNHSILHHNMS